MILGLKNLVVTRPQQGVFSGTWKGFGVLGRTHKTSLRGGVENTPKSYSPYWRLWHQQQIIRCATATSLSQKVRIMPDFFAYIGPVIHSKNGMRREKNGTKTEYYGRPPKKFGKYNEALLSLHRKWTTSFRVHAEKMTRVHSRRLQSAYIISGQFCGKDAALK